MTSKEGAEVRQGSDSASTPRRRDKTTADTGGPPHFVAAGQRLLILDTRDRSELAAREIASLAKHDSLRDVYPSCSAMCSTTCLNNTVLEIMRLSGRIVVSAIGKKR